MESRMQWINLTDMLTEIRTTEILKVINDQFANVSLEYSNKLKINSVVLLKNITNKESMKP